MVWLELNLVLSGGHAYEKVKEKDMFIISSHYNNGYFYSDILNNYE